MATLTEALLSADLARNHVVQRTISEAALYRIEGVPLPDPDTGQCVMSHAPSERVYIGTALDVSETCPRCGALVQVIGSRLAAHQRSDMLARLRRGDWG